MNIAISIENLSKQYRLGLVSTRTLSHDINRWWQINIRGKEDPYLKISEINDRTKKGESEYVWALKDINIDVKEGEVLGIIGKNGAGKSTLLKILSKVTTPTTGSIKACGRIASLLEVGTGFHPEMTGRENIFLNGAILGMNKSEIRRKLDEIIDFAGVERYIDTPVKRYSSGMMVRLGFAVAAHLEPEILIVDEVLAVGDAEFQKKAIGKMKDVSSQKGRTVLFVSHNMSSIKSLCQEGVYLKNGQIKYTGIIENTITNYLSEEASIKTKVTWEKNDRPGDGAAFLISAKLIDENLNDITTVSIKDKIGIEFIYEVLQEGVSRIPNIHLFTVKGDYVFVSGDKDKPELKKKGIFRTIMWIPSNLLNTETYIVGIALSTMSPVKVHFYAQEALIFEIVEDINHRQNEYKQIIPGLIRPDLNWDTELI